MDQPVTCFFAYPSNPPSLAETLENAIQSINSNGYGIVQATSWKSLSVPGKLIIREVCRSIDTNNLFVCDLTTINMNVLFELGYAIAKDKRIWITLDKTISNAKETYRRLDLLASVGYAPYENEHEIRNLFFKEEPYKHLDETLYRDVIQRIVQKNIPPALLYLKSEINTSVSIKLSNHLAGCKIPLVIDDPTEVRHQTLEWYVQQIWQAHGVIAHLLGHNREGRFPQNAKYSLVSGIAYGFGRPLLMLADAPYDPPIDYQDLLFVSETATECLHAVNRWLPPIEELYSARQSKFQDRRTGIEAANVLQHIYLGQYMAENEQQDLSKYFIVTSAYTEALQMSQSMIYIGRRGSGKTANLFAVADKLSENPENHVCIIRPIDYELEGVLNLLSSSISKAEQGFLVAALWKFLVYTELAHSVYKSILSEPLHYNRTQEESNFIKYVDEHEELIKTAFTVRMEHVIQDLCRIDTSDVISNQRAKVSEILHDTLLGELRDRLGLVLERKHKVCVLIDGLDKAWTRKQDLALLSDFLFGLLSVSGSITDQFKKRGSGTWRPVNLSMLIFLRSDIFGHIMSEARERGKLIFKRIDWNDPQLLERVIEKRFISSLQENIAPDEVWRTFFSATIKGQPAKDYIINRIYPRPRDAIYFCKAALAHAVNRQHAEIDEEDLVWAETEYSKYAFDSLIDETIAQFDQIEDVLYEFAGAREVITRTDLVGFLNKAHTPVDRLDDIIGLLVDATFLVSKQIWGNLNSSMTKAPRKSCKH